MPNEAVIKTIDLILAPVVMVTACGIMLNGLILRYNWLSDRVRSVYQERLLLLESEIPQNSIKGDRIHHLDHLLPDLLDHHHQVHDVLVTVYLSILVFMLDMLVIALAASSDFRWLSQLVIVVFLLGIAILLWGIVLIAYELRSSHHVVQLEVHHDCHACKMLHGTPNRKKRLS